MVILYSRLTFCVLGIVALAFRHSCKLQIANANMYIVMLSTKYF